MQRATTLNKYSFRCIHMLSPFYIKTNLRKNRFFAAKWTIGEKKALIMLNFLLKTWQKQLYCMHAQVGSDTERTYVYNNQRERLWGMLLTTNQDYIMEKQK